MAYLGAERISRSWAGLDIRSQDGAEDRLVKHAGATGGRELEPEDKRRLEDVVRREVVQDHAQSKRFEEREEPKNGPVGQPTCQSWLAGK